MSPEKEETLRSGKEAGVISKVVFTGRISWLSRSPGSFDNPERLWNVDPSKETSSSELNSFTFES